MTLDITQFYQTFFDEADELLAQMEQLLLNLDIGHPDPEDLAAIFRAAHSIKGGAATFGFTALTETTHILESLLDRARNNELKLRKDMIDTFLETKDVLSGQLADYRASAEPDAAVAGAICAKLEQLYAESRFGETQAAAAPASAPAAQPAVVVSSDGRAPEHVVEQAVQVAGELAGAEPAQTGTATSAAGGETGPHLKITLRGVGEKDQDLLAEELGNLGHIVGRVKSGGDLTLWLQTDVTSDDIIAVCCFVIDDSQISIGRGTAPVEESEQGEPGTPTAADQTPASASSAPASPPAPRHGLFEPVVQQAAAPAPVAAAPAPELVAAA
ncbi:MAG: Hpt domain-containing protein, partial [Paraburkholderia sp.]|uniref:Hpt domain-containing protein n=1 Tax=Paraburkholderia sp. TaxID=1926495 RepID=UPI003C3CD588